MAAVFKNFFGDSKPSAVPVVAGDSDFADFAEAPAPEAPVHADSPASSRFGSPLAHSTGSVAPYSKWYNVHERHSLSEFQTEGLIFIIMAIIFTVHIWGTRTNRTKAKVWINAYAPALEKEFSLVGFAKQPLATEDADGQKIVRNLVGHSEVQLLKEKSLYEFKTYGTGRANVAFVDASILLYKRYNPFLMLVEYGVSFFVDSLPAPVEKMESIIYAFDGMEARTVPGFAGGHDLRGTGGVKERSTYDGFVFAVVNKDSMKRLRDDRYDISITSTKDNPKLPVWATTMSEAAEITDMILTPELISAIEEAGELFEALIISDQPVDKPTKIEETTPKKRVYLSVKLPASASDYQKTLPLFAYFLRIPDFLVQNAHLRPDLSKKVRSTRENHIKQLQKVDEDEKAEERALEREKLKKIKREQDLKGLDAKAQKKYLEKEREKEMKRAQKKQTVKG